MRQQTFFNKKGFTLIELLIVIAIIGLLSSIMIVSLKNVRAKARDTRRITDLRQLQTALELFYHTHGRYPITGGGPYWDDHWNEFSTCLETGSGCGFVISGYTPVMSEVPQDPLDGPGSSDIDPTYYTGWDGRTEQNYILRAYLENNNPALSNDADGGWRSSGDGGCDDPWYCIKQNWPW